MTTYVDPEDIDMVVCFRKDQIIREAEGSVSSECDACEQPIWIGPNVALFVAARVGSVPVVCANCAILLKMAMESENA